MTVSPKFVKQEEKRVDSYGKTLLPFYAGQCYGPQEIKIDSKVNSQWIDVNFILPVKTATTSKTCSPSVKAPKKEKRGIIGFIFIFWISFLFHIYLVDKYEGKESMNFMGIYQFNLFRKGITRTLHFLAFNFSVTKTEQRATFLHHRGQLSGALFLYILLPRKSSSPTVFNTSNLLRERRVQVLYSPNITHICEVL